MNEFWQRAGWPVARLADFAAFYSGGTPSRKRADFFGGAIPWLTGQDIPEDSMAEVSNGREFVTEGGIKESATNLVPPGTVLVTTRVTVGKTAVAARPLCFSQDVTGVRIRSESIATPHFLAYYLRSQRQKLLQRNQGSTIAGITRDSLALELIPLPPLSEQRRIVEILQEAEHVRRLRSQAQAKTAQLIPAIFHQLFQATEERDAWEETTVERIAVDRDNSIRTGPFGSDLLHSEFVDAGIPVLGIDNVVSNRFRWAERRYIRLSKFADLRRFKVFPDDVMITIMGTVGRVAIAPPDLPEAISTKHLCVITPERTKVLPTFLWATLLYDSSVRAQTRSVGKGAIMEGWNSKIIRGLRFRCPPIELQEVFDELIKEVFRLEDLIEPTESLFNANVSSLLAHAFTGELTAEWRERHRAQLEQEAHERDEALKALGVAISRPVVSEAEIALPTTGAYSHLTREQKEVLREMFRSRNEEARRRRLPDDNFPMWMNAEQVSKRLTGPLHGNTHAVESHLAVLAARGLVIAVSREEEDPKTGEILYGNASRLPLKDKFSPLGDGTGGYIVTEPDEDIVVDEPGDHARLREMQRLVGQLEKERML